MFVTRPPTPCLPMFHVKHHKQIHKLIPIYANEKFHSVDKNNQHALVFEMYQQPRTKEPQ